MNDFLKLFCPFSHLLFLSWLFAHVSFWNIRVVTDSLKDSPSFRLGFAESVNYWLQRITWKACPCWAATWFNQRKFTYTSCLKEIHWDRHEEIMDMVKPSQKGSNEGRKRETWASMHHLNGLNRFLQYFFSLHSLSLKFAKICTCCPWQKQELKQVVILWTPVLISFTSFLCHNNDLILQPLGCGRQPIVPPLYNGNTDALLPGRG